MSKTAYVNGDIYTGEAVYATHALLIEDSTIVGIVEPTEIPDGYVIVDVEGMNIAPGFIDLQVNGGNDVLFNDSPTPETVIKIRDGHRKYGTTSILPTFITDTVERMGQARAAVEDCLEEERPGVLGLHFEGPLISAAKAGVHDQSHIVEHPSRELDGVYQPLKSGVLLVTLAPEAVSADYIRALKDRGVLVACGHTNATREQTHSAVEAGVSLGTHVFNAMTSLSSRDPGVAGTLLADDRVSCDFVVDGFHVDFDVLKIAFAAKPRGKAFLVTDAMPPVGGSSKTYVLGPYTITQGADGRCTTEDGVLAGSGLNMATAVRNTMQKIGIPKDEALRMASTYPASYVGVDGYLGYIRPGYRADLVLFSNEIYVDAVVCAGQYQKV